MNPILARRLGAPEGYDTTAWDGPDLYVQTPSGMGRLGNMDPSTEDFYSAKNSPLYYQDEGGLWQLYGQNTANQGPPPPSRAPAPTPNPQGPTSGDLYSDWGGGAPSAPVGQPGMVYGRPSQSMQLPLGAGGQAPAGSIGASPYGSFWDAYNAGVARQTGPTPYGGLPALVQGAGKVAAE